jgi:putative FmdB family regulatory protein
MPLYEFECGKCGQVFEELCRLGSNGKGIACPGCAGKRLRRLMSVFAVHSSSREPAAAESRASCSTCSSKQCSTCN